MKHKATRFIAISHSSSLSGENEGFSYSSVSNQFTAGIEPEKIYLIFRFNMKGNFTLKMKSPLDLYSFIVL